MPKRRLTSQQRRRIAEQRQRKRQLVNTAHGDLHESKLGQSQAGLVTANYGSQAMVEPEHSSDDDMPVPPERCHLRAHLDVVTGDKVMWRPGTKPHLGIIESRFKRTSELQRPDIYGKLRTIAANASQMLITLAPSPEPHLNLIDRYLVAAHIQNLHPVIVINKCELIDDCEDHIAEKIRHIDAVYRAQNIPVIYVSAHLEHSISELQTHLQAHNSIFVGQSGVGKSSLIKALLPEQCIRIGALSDATEKGKHTTTHAQLFHFDFGGHCIDSPGIREFGLWHANADQVLSAFPTIAEYAKQCKFRDCHHKHEPHCAVLNAVEKSAITKERFESYQRILSQLNDVEIQTEK